MRRLLVRHSLTRRGGPPKGAYVIHGAAFAPRQAQYLGRREPSRARSSRA